MLPLNFKTFIERYKLQVEANRRATLHYKEDEKKFTLYFKNHELWEYFTIIKKSQIIEFGGSLYSANPEEAIEDFRINYLSHAVPLDKDISGDLAPLDGPVPEFSKSTDPVVTEEAEDYEQFFIRIVDEWEQKVLTALNAIEIHSNKNTDIISISREFVYFGKTFGEFVQGLFNGVHTRKFLVSLRRVIKNSMAEGMDVAEEEMEVNVGWNSTFQNKLRSLENQQLEGYTINGKKWHGIKGTTQELRIKILNSVQEDVKNKVGREKMTENIKEIFSGSTTSQAKRIARTETNRFINESKLTTYDQSGIKGYKSWSAVLDTNTGDLDRRLHNKYFEKGIPFDEEFVDKKTGKRFMNPPTRPNCRCVIEYRTPPSTK